MQEIIWGEVAARREGRRRAAAGPGLCAEGGWGPNKIVRGKNNVSLNSFNDSHITAAKLLQSCPTLYDRMDSSPPGSSVHGVL